MARLTGGKPAHYIPASLIKVGGVYVAQNARPYRVSSIHGSLITCHRVRKVGGESRYATTGVYGYSLFFTEELEVPPTPAEPTVHERAVWTNEGRSICRGGTPMFTLHRQEMSPVELDRFVRKLVRLLNAMEG